MGLLLIERHRWPRLSNGWGPRLGEVGRFFYLEIQMTGRRVLWMISFKLWVLIYLTLSKETAWFGNCRRRGFLTSARSTISSEVPCLLSFLGKVFGRLRLLHMPLSLFGLQLGRRFLQGIFCGVEASILLIGAFCAVVMGRRRIICFSIVKKLISCGAWFLDPLGFLGPCQDRLQICFLVGGIGLETTHLAFGI